MLALGLFFVFLLSANFSGQQITDNVSSFTAGWAMGQHGTLDISSAPDIKPWTVQVGDELHSDRAPGILLWVSPFYAIFGDPLYPTIFPAGLAAATAAAGAMAGLFLLFCRFARRDEALFATLVAAFGTATWTISADAVWPHGPNQLWLILMMLGLSCQRPLLAGVAGGLALLTRPLTALSVALVGITMSAWQRTWKPVLKIGAVSSLFLLCLLVYNRWAFHEWTLTPGSYGAFVSQFAGRGETYVPTKPVDLIVNLAGALVSPSRGIFVLSPFLLLLLPGLSAAWRQSAPWIRSSAVAGLGYAFAQVWGNNYAGGAGFYSYRYTIESLTLLSPLFLMCWKHWTSLTQRRRLAFQVLVLVAVFQHIAGALYVTPSLPHGYKSWHHFLLLEALREGTAVQILFIASASCVALLTILSAGKVRDNRPLPVTDREADLQTPQ